MRSSTDYPAEHVIGLRLTSGVAWSAICTIEEALHSLLSPKTHMLSSRCISCDVHCAGAHAQTSEPGRSDRDSWRTTAGTQSVTVSSAAVAASTSSGDVFSGLPPPPPPPPPLLHADPLSSKPEHTSVVAQHTEATAAGTSAASEKAGGWQDVLVAGCRDAQLRLWVTGCEVGEPHL